MFAASLTFGKAFSFVFLTSHSPPPCWTHFPNYLLYTGRNQGLKSFIQSEKISFLLPIPALFDKSLSKFEYFSKKFSQAVYVLLFQAAVRLHISSVICPVYKLDAKSLKRMQKNWIFFKKRHGAAQRAVLIHIFAPKNNIFCAIMIDS